MAKMERHREALIRGYIAMLVVEKKYRYLGVGKYRPTIVSRSAACSAYKHVKLIIYGVVNFLCC